MRQVACGPACQLSYKIARSARILRPNAIGCIYRESLFWPCPSCLFTRLFPRILPIEGHFDGSTVQTGNQRVEFGVSHEAAASIRTRETDAKVGKDIVLIMFLGLIYHEHLSGRSSLFHKALLGDLGR